VTPNLHTDYGIAEENEEHERCLSPVVFQELLPSIPTQDSFDEFLDFGTP